MVLLKGFQEPGLVSDKWMRVLSFFFTCSCNLDKRQGVFNLKSSDQIGEKIKMTVARKLGTLVVFGVPAIIGGGIVYAIFGSFIPVVVFEGLLILFAGGLVSK
jgi:hypothetical protein